MAIQKQAQRYPCFLVDIVVVGRLLRLQLDSGTAYRLTVTVRSWSRLSCEFRGVSLKERTLLYPYIGRLPCRAAVVRELPVGARLLKRSRVIVLPDDGALLSGTDGLIGMACFRDTWVMPDFQRMALWVSDNDRET